MKIKNISVLIALCASSSIFATTLSEITKDAIANDIKLNQADMNMFIQSKNIDMVKSQYKPTIDLNTGINYGVNNSDNIPYTDQTTGTLNIGLNYNLYDPTRDINLSIEELKLGKVIYENLSYRQELISNIANIYYNILKTEKIIEVNKENLKAVESQYSQISEMVNVGLKSTVDLKDIKANKDNVYADLISSENALDNLKTELFTYTGKDYNEIKDVIFKEEKQNLTNKDQAFWEKEMLSKNPKISSNLITMKIVQKEIAQAESSDDLHINLQGKIGTDYNNRLNDDKFGESANIGLNISIPLYTGGYTKALTDQTKYRFINASTDLIHTKRVLIPELKRVLNDLKSLDSKIKAYKESVISSKSSLEATKAGFTVGTRTIVDVLNANTQYFVSKKNLYSSQYDYLLKEKELEKTVGILKEEN